MKTYLAFALEDCRPNSCFQHFGLTGHTTKMDGRDAEHNGRDCEHNCHTGIDGRHRLEQNDDHLCHYFRPLLFAVDARLGTPPPP